MGLFTISYDLIKRKDYQTLWDELDRLRAHKAMASFYLANLTVEDPVEVRDHLKKFIDEDDKLMVTKLVGKPSFTKANAGTNDWISKNCG